MRGPAPEWWKEHGSDALNALVDEGLKNTPSLRAAESRLVERVRNLGAHHVERHFYFDMIAKSGGTVLAEQDALLHAQPLHSGHHRGLRIFGREVFDQFV